MVEFCKITKNKVTKISEMFFNFLYNLIKINLGNGKLTKEILKEKKVKYRKDNIGLILMLTRINKHRTIRYLRSIQEEIRNIS